jgi:hypothetical protein
MRVVWASAAPPIGGEKGGMFIFILLLKTEMFSVLGPPPTASGDGGEREILYSLSFCRIEMCPSSPNVLGWREGEIFIILSFFRKTVIFPSYCLSPVSEFRLRPPPAPSGGGGRRKDIRLGLRPLTFYCQLSSSTLNTDSSIIN